MVTRFWSFGTGLLGCLFFDDVFYDAIHNTPLDEVELSDRRRESLKLDARRTTKRVKELLGVAVQTRLVGDVDREHLPIWGSVSDLLILCVICDKPL